MRVNPLVSSNCHRVCLLVCTSSFTPQLHCHLDKSEHISANCHQEFYSDIKMSFSKAQAN